MKVILGTYRGPKLVERALESLRENLTGMTALTIVDDSGEAWPVELYESYTLQGPGRKIIRPKVVALNKVGYTKAMGRVCREANGQRFMFWEEDFTLDEPVDLADLSKILDSNPTLAQIALLRGPHFPIEHEHGGVLEGLLARLGTEKVDIHTHASWSASYNSDTKGYDFTTEVGYYSQLGTFTCNPSVWRDGITKEGWPQGQWSEDRMRDRLIARGFRFGFLPKVQVTHDGERSGHGY